MKSASSQLLSRRIQHCVRFFISAASVFYYPPSALRLFAVPLREIPAVLLYNQLVLWKRSFFYQIKETSSFTLEKIRMFSTRLEPSIAGLDESWEPDSQCFLEITTGCLLLRFSLVVNRGGTKKTPVASWVGQSGSLIPVILSLDY